MLTAPKIGQRVMIWYRAGLREVMPLHGRTGTVVMRSTGKPRNHGIEIDGQVYVVPCGNVRKPE